MTKQIMFEGKIHSFPDDATDEEMNEMLPGYKPDETLFDKVSNEVSGAVHMPLGRSLKNIGQGAIELGQFVTNPAGPAMKYLAGKEIPYISAAAKHWPQYPESDVFGLGENQPGDMLFQAATPTGPAIKGVQFAGKPLKEIVELALSSAPKAASKASKAASKAGDKLPILKSISSRPYKKQMNILEEKGLLQGYKPNANDILEATRILTSKGMKIPHEAINEAAAQALAGNYKPWFNIQSSLRKEGRRLSSMGGVHRTLGEKLHELAEKMHAEIGEAQAARGAPEAAELMYQGKERTAKYHKLSPMAKASSGIASAALLPKWVYQMLKAAGKK